MVKVVVKGEVVVEEGDVEKSLMNLLVKERRNYFSRLRFNVTIVKRMGILHLNLEMRKKNQRREVKLSNGRS